MARKETSTLEVYKADLPLVHRCKRALGFKSVAELIRGLMVNFFALQTNPEAAPYPWTERNDVE